MKPIKTQSGRYFTPERGFVISAANCGGSLIYPLGWTDGDQESTHFHETPDELAALIEKADREDRRELFAAMAMQGLLACPDIEATTSDLAIGAVASADAILAALAKETQ